MIQAAHTPITFAVHDECSVGGRWLDGAAVVMLTLVSRRPDGPHIGNHVSVTNPTVPAFSGPADLVTAIAQDATTGRVLMVAHMNREAWEETLRTGRAVYFSRTRGRLWRKGEESGNVQKVREVFVDCDGDAVLLKVEQVGGAACHEGYPSCFFRQITPDGLKIIAERMFDPAQVYRQSN